jgi:hypothetical protein
MCGVYTASRDLRFHICVICEGGKTKKNRKKNTYTQPWALDAPLHDDVTNPKPEPWTLNPTPCSLHVYPRSPSAWWCDQWGRKKKTGPVNKPNPIEMHAGFSLPETRPRSLPEPHPVQGRSPKNKYLKKQVPSKTLRETNTLRDLNPTLYKVDRPKTSTLKNKYLQKP